MTSEARTDPPALLLMGYGSPKSPEELPGYLTDILHRPPSEEMVAEYRRRYELIGGSPQRRILESLRSKVERRLGGTRAVYLGMKHWEPNLREVVPQIAADGHERIVAVPLSPYASTWILEPYRATLAEGQARCASAPSIDLRAGWHLDPHWIGYWAEAIGAARRGPGDGSEPVLLSAHSLPKRYADQGDPYPELLRATSRAIAEAGALPQWSFTFQSAGNTTEPWLGPDITELIREWKGRGARSVLVASFGFVFDHLEVLYDLDVVVRAFAEAEGVAYRRVPMPNDADAIVESLVSVARAPASPAPGGRGSPGTGAPGPREPGAR
jgi:ferrochelatase